MRGLRIIIVLGIAAVLAAELWRALRHRAAPVQAHETRETPFDPAFLRLSAAQIAALPVTELWQMPMGSELGALTYNAQPFRITRHLGDDLNGIGGYNSDLGDAVWSAADGLVVFCGEAGVGWGKMVIVACKSTPPGEPEPSVMQAVYAHLADIAVLPGQRVKRGERIGSVGTAEGKYLAHLHFELRRGPWVYPGEGYADSGLNRVSPEAWIAKKLPQAWR
jgi:hypothetical protein